MVTSRETPMASWWESILDQQHSFVASGYYKRLIFYFINLIRNMGTRCSLCLYREFANSDASYFWPSWVSVYDHNNFSKVTSKTLGISEHVETVTYTEVLTATGCSFK